MNLFLNKKYKQIQYVYAPNGNHVREKFSKTLGKEAIQLLINELK